ncbi:MAG: hypothetical protein NTW03_03050 [Verrucomicrobia bacterium]|nr:hypothetical protein [Verrucomicrobiota bacterium]
MSTTLLGNGSTLVVDSTNAAWLQYNVIDNDGYTNLAVDQGAVIFWFAPNWASTNAGGTGPGVWGRLIEAGSYTEDASYGWWSLYVDSDGANIFFSAQTNGGLGATYLSAPIDWTSNSWHYIALNYTSSNSALYLDGTAVTNGLPVTYWPGSDVLSNGFWIGSDSNGVAQAHGAFDDFYTYDCPLSPSTIALNYLTYSMFWYGATNYPRITSAPTSPEIPPLFNANTGYGFLLTNVGSATGCTTSSNVWITNVVGTHATNGTMTMNVTFSIIGGTNGLPYDVFANSVLAPASDTIHPWAWMGQGYPCNRYMLTNLPLTTFLILGTPQDLDGDGLTDAYERLVSKTDPNKADTSGDGMLDGWKVFWGLNPLQINTLMSGQLSTFGYDPAGRLHGVTGARTEPVEQDPEGNVTKDSQQ